MKNLQVANLTLSFAERKILDDVSFNLSERSRCALAGANGCGKSTLFKCVAGIQEADDISISATKDARISYLPQSDIVFPGETVYEAAEKGYERFVPKLEELTALENSLGKDPDADMKAAVRISELHDELLDSGYYERKSRIGTILMGLGFREKDFDASCSTFSGGWQMRIALAKVLIENPDFLLLDEPTNYLDIEALTWLEEYLRGFHGGLMLVSHDQDFLDNTVNIVYELFNGKLREYAGNYTKYLEVREEELRTLQKSWEKQQEEIKKTEEFIERFRYKATKAKQVQSRITMLEKKDIIEIPSHLKKVHFSFPEAPRSGNDVMVVENLRKAYGQNVVYDGFSFIVNRGERLAITGRNGTGKSTLLRILAGVDPDYGGVCRDGAGVLKGYFAQDNADMLEPSNSILEELESVVETSDIPKVRNMLGAFLFQDDDVFKKCAVLSGGERSRLSLLKILTHPANLLLLDEPTNHLDINTKEILLEALEKYEGTVIFVSHDKHFISHLATRILYLDDNGPEFYEGSWEYFNEKLHEKEARYRIEKAEAKAAEAEVKTQNQLSHEEMKARRNRRKALEREIEKLEARMEELENDIALLEEESGKEEVYSVASKITAVLRAKEEKEAEKEGVETKWLEKTEEAEALDAEDD